MKQLKQVYNKEELSQIIKENEPELIKQLHTY